MNEITRKVRNKWWKTSWEKKKTCEVLRCALIFFTAFEQSNLNFWIWQYKVDLQMWDISSCHFITSVPVYQSKWSTIIYVAQCQILKHYVWFNFNSPAAIICNLSPFCLWCLSAEHADDRSGWYGNKMGEAQYWRYKPDLRDYPH